MLHITGDRAPSIAFRVLDPADPIAQREWAKQEAVTSVRPQVARDDDDNADPAAPRDTIEVYANFRREDGFFGLTSYLGYVRTELGKVRDWVGQAARRESAPHEFPWRYLDDTNITAEGFEPRGFQFTVDQGKVLDLLTGHTLYNDTSVVLRELLQNALDAIRLQAYMDEISGSAGLSGRVAVRWDSAQRVLEVEDNGTGMTQDIIEEHLLTVCRSRYQDPEFTRQYPDFHPISRFGIGILTTFMIADQVEIVTSHPDEAEARHLGLRSVHGRYLVRLLDKESDTDAQRLSPHGTLVRLRVRPSAEVGDVLATVRKWVVVPGCEVLVGVDGRPPVTVGFASCREALEEDLRRGGARLAEDEQQPGPLEVRVVQHESPGLQLAYAVEWQPYFREWSFARLRDPDGPGSGAVGTCVQGVRVEPHTPGYEETILPALANATGARAPRTNVARSALEASDGQRQMLASVYQGYVEHVTREVQTLCTSRNASQELAAREAYYLLMPLLARRSERKPLAPDLLLDAAGTTPVAVVERSGRRALACAAELDQQGVYWTVHAEFTRWAERLMESMPGTSSLAGLVAAFDHHYPPLPDPLLCTVTVPTGLRPNREVAAIHVHASEARIDLMWDRVASPPRWACARDWTDEVCDRLWSLARERARADVSVIWNVHAGVHEVHCVNVPAEALVVVDRRSYAVPGSRISELLRSQLACDSGGPANDDAILAAASSCAFVAVMASNPAAHTADADGLVRMFQSESRELPALLHPDLPAIMADTEVITFDPDVWKRDVDL